MDRLRIAVLSYGLPVVGQKRGGVDRVAHDLGDGLARRGHEVTVWTYDEKPAGAAYDVQELPGKRLLWSWLGKRLTMGYLGNLLPLLLDRRDYDILIAHGDSLLVPLLRKPVLRVVHGSALKEALSATSPWRFVLQLGVYGQELLCGLGHDGAVAVSHSARAHNPFIRHVIPNGVNLKVFSPASGARSAVPTILFVGTPGGRKRGALLVKWFTHVVQPRLPAARLEMVSTPGPGADGVTYHTGITTADLVLLYRRAWVYASPSCYEGFGLPYVEALACGTPVLATPNPGSREVLGEGQYGVLADDVRFADELCAILADAPRREALTVRGLERAQKYSDEIMLDRYEALLYRLCRRSRRREHRIVS
jgi:phosphatidyl-myo-inositol alpha-mannosyltransferase